MTFTPAAFDLLQNWFQHPLVIEQKADPGLLSAALECWFKNAQILPDAPNELPTARHFRYGQTSMLEHAKYIASQIRRDPEPYPAPQDPAIEANVQVEESGADSDHWAS